MLDDKKVGERKVLIVTSMTEFAERYGYYTLQSLLVFFLIDKFGISQSLSASLVGTTLAMVYLSSILGGYISERYIGYYRSGILGSFTMFLGFSILSICSEKSFLYLGLSFISISTGLIKSNMASFIGKFYDENSSGLLNRDFGFNMFYMGINLGSFFALLLSGYLKDNYGYATPYYISLLINFLIFIFLILNFKKMRKYMLKVDINLHKIIKVFSMMFLYIIFLFIVFKYSFISDFSVLIATIISAFIVFLSIKSTKSYNVILSIVVFLTLSVIYWALFFQIFISLLVFINYCVDSTIINSTQMISIESLTVIILAYFMGRLWKYSKDNKINIKDIDKFNLGILFLTLGFISILFSIHFASLSGKMGISGFVVGYIFIGISELCLSAVGLSVLTRLAPKGFVSLYMSIWLVTLGIGGKLSGVIASFIYIPSDNMMLARENMSTGLIFFIIGGLITFTLTILLRNKVN
ncbi:peptide MFS transporter [Francisellaceae bacterium CB300]